MCGLDEEAIIRADGWISATVPTITCWILPFYVSQEKKQKIGRITKEEMVKNNNSKIPQWLPLLQMLGDMKSSIINPLLFQFHYWGQNDWNRTWESRNAMTSVRAARLLTWIPSRRERSVSIASRGESFPLSESQPCATNPQTRRQKEKGRVCLVEEGGQ